MDKDTSDYFKVPPGKIGLYNITDNNQRRDIHTYLEKHHPFIHKTSLTCQTFEREYTTFGRCKSETCHKRGRSPIFRMSYKHRFAENNEDEYYSGLCPECGESSNWECNYDEHETIRKWDNNIIVFGDYFSNYSNRVTKAKCDIINLQQMEEIMKDKELIIIDQPPKQLGKRSLISYIDSCLK